MPGPKLQERELSEHLKIAAEGWVLVCDGRKALVLKNAGDEMFPNLQVKRIFEAPENPPTHEQGSDRPPRAVSGMRRSSIEQTDWHDLAEQRFVDDVADALSSAHQKTPLRSLVVVAPPRALAELRKEFSNELRKVIVAEIHKDLTKHPVHEIEQHLTA